MITTAIEAPFGGERRVDAASAVVFRVTFGLLLCVVALRFFFHGWIRTYYVQPTHFFSYYGLSWVKPWPGHWMYVHYAVIALSALTLSAGLFYRVSATVLFLSFSYAHFCDKTNYLNHYYLLSLLAFLLIFLPLHRTGSLDAWRRPALRQRTVPAWVPWLLRFQLGVVYFFGGVGKLKGDWLWHAQPLRLWLSANADIPWVGAVLDRSATAYVFSWAGLLFDLGVPFALCWRRSRPFAYAAAIGFHLTTARLLPIGMFPWIMMLLDLIFFPPAWPRRWLPAVWQTPGRWLPRPDEPATETFPLHPTLWSLPGWVVVYGLVQVIVPLRHGLYPGNVCWTEEGFRFAWNVMLMEKSGTAEFLVHERSTGREWSVSNRTLLTPYQIKMMTTQPDMLLEAAHWVADDFRRRGFSDFDVRVETYVTLNGRPGRPLVDPHIDLASLEEGWAPKRWILP